MRYAMRHGYYSIGLVDFDGHFSSNDMLSCFGSDRLDSETLVELKEGSYCIFPHSIPRHSSARAWERRMYGPHRWWRSVIFDCLIEAQLLKRMGLGEYLICVMGKKSVNHTMLQRIECFEIDDRSPHTSPRSFAGWFCGLLLFHWSVVCVRQRQRASGRHSTMHAVCRFVWYCCCCGVFSWRVGLLDV